MNSWSFSEDTSICIGSPLATSRDDWLLSPSKRLFIWIHCDSFTPGRMTNYMLICFEKTVTVDFIVYPMPPPGSLGGGRRHTRRRSWARPHWWVISRRITRRSWCGTRLRRGTRRRFRWPRASYPSSTIMKYSTRHDLGTGMWLKLIDSRMRLCAVKIAISKWSLEIHGWARVKGKRSGIHHQQHNMLAWKKKKGERKRQMTWNPIPL